MRKNVFGCKNMTGAGIVVIDNIGATEIGIVITETGSS
jgi:hypothetical protein